MSDDIRVLSTELARDPQSLVFLRLGELLIRPFPLCHPDGATGFRIETLAIANGELAIVGELR